MAALRVIEIMAGDRGPGRHPGISGNDDSAELGSLPVVPAHIDLEDPDMDADLEELLLEGEVGATDADSPSDENFDYEPTKYSMVREAVRSYDPNDAAEGGDHAWRETDHDQWGTYPVHDGFDDESMP